MVLKESAFLHFHIPCLLNSLRNFYYNSDDYAIYCLAGQYAHTRLLSQLLPHRMNQEPCSSHLAKRVAWLWSTSLILRTPVEIPYPGTHWHSAEHDWCLTQMSILLWQGWTDGDTTRLDTRKRFSTERVVGHRNRLPRELVTAPRLPEFKEHLDDALSPIV